MQMKNESAVRRFTPTPTSNPPAPQSANPAGYLVRRARKVLAGVGLIASLLLGSDKAQAQSFLDCSCLQTQAVLFTPNCTGTIPDLCLVVTNCWFPSVASTGFTCSQFPPPGTPVTGSTPIAFTLFDLPSNTPYSCNLMYNVGFTTNRFTLICPTNQIVPCNTTNFTFYGPPGWTNIPPCCTNPVTILGPFITTNWPVLTAQWIGQACGVVDFCQETIFFGGLPPVGTNCPCLDLICPSNIVVQTCLNSTSGVGFTNLNYPLPVVSNTCIGIITNLVCTPPPGSPFPVGTNTVTCTVQDSLGNSATCSFDIIVLGDTDPPVINCPGFQTVSCGSGWAPTPPVVFDVCCGPNVSVQLIFITTNSTGPCSETILMDWHITDCNGNVTNCSQVVQIVDNTPPVLLCNSNQIVQCGTTAAGGGWTPTPPPAFDACCPAPPVVTLAGIVTNSSATCSETLTLTWMAEDCCTNIAYCTEVVTITDTNPPFLNCQPFKQIECGSGPNWFGDFPTALDDCCGTNITLNLIGVITNIQTTCFSDYTLAWTATDCCTNTSLVCTQRLQIIDTLPPTVICGTNKIVPCGTAWTFDPPIAIDDCCTNPPTITVLSTTTNGLCPIDIIRTWQITDCCGNTTNCTQVVMVVDNVPPIITCNSNQTVQCGSAWALTPPTATDNCCTNASGGPGVQISLVSVTTNSFGPCNETITALWMATDCCGNKSVCTETITVVDTVPPVVTCNSNQTYQCGAPVGSPGAWVLTPPAAFDACCGTNVAVTLFNAVTNGAIPCNEIITLTWQATDCCTNSTFCTEVVTLTDTTPPVLTCATNKFVECGTNWNFDPPTAFDLCCGTNVTITVLSNVTWVSSTCLSIYEQFWMATDCCTNNSAVCSQRVVVQDTTPPDVICPNNLTVPCGSPWTFTPPTALDACCGTNVTISVLSTTTNGICPIDIIRTWQITDCCGNSTNCTQVVFVVDNIPPVITCAPNQSVQCGTTWTFNPPTVTDNCCNPASLSVGIGNISTNILGPCQEVLTVIWKATDCCGNSSFCTNTVTVSDTLPPVLACNTNYILQCGSPLIPPVATDLCCPNPVVSILNAITNTTGPCTSVLTITWQATDCCTNTAFCTEVITITDTTPPVATCSPNKTVQCGTQWTFDPPTAFDTCCGSNVTISVLSTSPLFGTACSQSSTRTWLITDCCSNAVTCAQTVTVVDTIPPVINCPPSFSVAPGSPWTFGTPTATDNCCLATIVVMSTTTNVLPGCQVVHTRTWRAQDCCGNLSAPCSQSIYTSTTAPPNDPCSNPFPIFVNAPYLCGSNICATPSLPGTLTPVPCGASANTPDVWYTVTAICTGPLAIDTCQPCAPHPTFDTVLSAYTGACGSLVQVPVTGTFTSCNDDSGPNGPCPWTLRSYIRFQAVAGQTYRIRVSGFAGSTGWFSVRATQSTTAPVNDLCVNAIPIAPGNPAACGSTLCGATPTPPGNLLPTPCGASANTPDVWYRFTPQCSGLVQINTCGTCPPAGTFDTVLSVYTGTCPGPLQQVAGGCNDDSGPSGPCPWTLQSFVQFNATAGVTYYIRVSGFAGGTGDFRLNLNQIITPPANDLCVNATPVNAGNYAWNNCGANTDGPGSPCGLQNDVWFNYTPACSGQVMLNTCGSSINTVASVYTGPCGALSLVTCNDNAAGGSCNGSQQSFLTFNATAGVTYRIRVGGAGGAQGAGLLNIVGPNPAATTCGSGPVSNWRLFIVSGAGNGIPWAWQVSSPCCANLYSPSTPGVFGSSLTAATAFANAINAQCPGTAFAINFWGNTFLIIGTRCGPTAPVILGVGPAGTAPNNLCIVSGLGLSTFGSCAFNPEIYEAELSGHDLNNNDRDDLIDIVLGDSQDTNGNLIPDEVEPCLAPEITAKPDSQIVELGQNVTLSVSVNGTAPFQYQWLRNGQPIPDATNSTLTINPVTEADLGAYTVTVSNDCGVIEGTSADVVVQPAYLPVLTDANLADGWFRFMVETKIGFNYVVEFKNDLRDPTWTTLTNAPGIGAPAFIYDDAPPADQRFYRVRQEPIP
jgi:hypothetical protein